MSGNGKRGPLDVESMVPPDGERVAAGQGTPEATALPGLRDAVLLPVELIRRWRDQPRSWFDDEKLQELAESIRLRGVLQPIRVRPDRRSHLSPGGYLITMGERRFLAARLAGLTEVPAIVHDVDETQALFDALAENLQRQDLTPDEENEAVRRLRERGLQDSEIARRLGVSKSTISRLVAVFDDPVLGPQVSNGRVTLTQARELLNLPDADRIRLADFLALRQQLSRPVGRTELRQLVTDAVGKRPAAPEEAPALPGAGPVPPLPPETRGGLINAPLRVVVDQGHPPPVTIPRATIATSLPPAAVAQPDPGATTDPAADDDGAGEDLALRDSRAERERFRAIARARELHNFVATMLSILDRHAGDPEIQNSLEETHALLGQALGSRE